MDYILASNYIDQKVASLKIKWLKSQTNIFLGYKFHDILKLTSEWVSILHKHSKWNTPWSVIIHTSTPLLKLISSLFQKLCQTNRK